MLDGLGPGATIRSSGLLLALLVCLTPVEGADPLTWQATMQLAGGKQKQGDYAGASKLLLSALKDAESFGPTDPRLGATLHELGAAHQELGKFPEAERYYERSIMVWEKASGKYSQRSLMQTISHLVSVCIEAGHLAKAEHLISRLLANRTNTRNEYDTALLLGYSAAIQQALGHFEKALPLYQQTLAIVERVSKPNDPAIGMTLNSLGLVYVDLGQTTEAEACFDRARENWETALGPRHTYVARALLNLIPIYCKTDRAIEAEALARRALSIAEERLGPDNTLTGLILTHYAEVLRLTNRKSEAKTLKKQAQSILNKSAKQNLQGYSVDARSLGRQVK
jgi:tetratricopeptide (TPR) repeat protein